MSNDRLLALALDSVLAMNSNPTMSAAARHDGDLAASMTAAERVNECFRISNWLSRISPEPTHEPLRMDDFRL